MMPTPSKRIVVAALAAIAFSAAYEAHGATSAPSSHSSLDKVLSAASRPSDVPVSIPEVRAQALKQLGVGLGMRAGLVDESKSIVQDIEKQKSDLDMKFNFGSLTFSNGALPPVIEESQDVISVTDFSMTVRGKLYRIVAPTTFLQNNWRNYLYLGLSNEDDPLVGDAQRGVLPKSEDEKAYWEKVVRTAYEEGRHQARTIFNLNLKRLERDFDGMRLFYTLYRQGLVSMPQFAEASKTINRPDPNTIIIGDTVFRVTGQSQFNGDSSSWKTTK